MGLFRFTSRTVDVIGPARKQVAAHAKRRLVHGVLEVIQTRPKFDKAPTQGQQHFLIGVGALGCRQALASADLGSGRCWQVWVAQWNVVVIQEAAAGRQLGIDIGAGEQHLGINLGLVADHIVAQCRNLGTLERRDEVVLWIEVEGVDGSINRARRRIDLAIASDLHGYRGARALRIARG